MKLPVTTNLFASRALPIYPGSSVYEEYPSLLKVFTVEQNDFRNNEYMPIIFFDPTNKTDALYIREQVANNAKQWPEEYRKVIPFRTAKDFEAYLLSGKNSLHRNSGLIFKPEFKINLRFDVVGKSGIETRSFKLTKVVLESYPVKGTMTTTDVKTKEIVIIPFTPIWNANTKTVDMINVQPPFQVVP